MGHTFVGQQKCYVV